MLARGAGGHLARAGRSGAGQCRVRIWRGGAAGAPALIAPAPAPCRFSTPIPATLAATKVLALTIKATLSHPRHTMPHLAPLPWDASPQFLTRFEHYQATRGFVPNSILTMQRRPAIAQAFMDLNKAVLYEGTVPEELKMLVSLVTSQASGCRYCQAHMTNLASLYQASDEKIRAVWDFESSPLFTEAERAALRLGYHAALVPNDVQAAHFERLKAHFDDGQIVEIVATIALFGYLNRWNDTMATALEPLAIEVATRAIGAVGWEAGKHGG